MNKTIFFLIFFLIFYLGISNGQTKFGKFTKEDYINSYCNLAIKEMKQSGVPASITLAQGIHESECGNSMLAVKGNNHFGIKCHSEWKGERLFKDDDEKNECFRKYNSVEESFNDHTDFLKNKSRYTFLFELNPSDYKGWAKGLKKAGYATNPKYPELIISIIENNNLSKFDNGIAVPKHQEKIKPTEKNKLQANKHEVGRKNSVENIIIRKGDTFFKIAEEFSLTIRFIHKCNDLGENDVLKEGQILYLNKKRNKAEPGSDFHIVKQGETLQFVSQLYCIKLSKLCKKNKLNLNDNLKTGDKLWLRKKKK